MSVAYPAFLTFIKKRRIRIEKNNTFTQGKILMTLTNLVSSFAMGTTVLLGQQIGCGERKQGGRTVGTAIVMFTVIALVMTAVLVIFAPQVSSIMNAPEEAFDKTVAYVRICGGGMLVIVAYNLIGCIFRGIGDSRTPLFTVAVACVFNIAGDLILCAGFKMGTSGAAFATVFAQIISVIVSFGVIRKKELPFEMHKTDIGVHGRTLRKMVGLGAPIALQDLLVSISFLIILAIVNSMGVTASAGVGVAEKVCAFIMLISSAFMQSISAFVAQNYGAGRMDRAKKLCIMVWRFLFPLVLECFSCHFSMEMCWREFFPPMQWSSRQRQIT